MSVSLAIVAHPARQKWAEQLGDTVGATIAYDLGAGSNATHDAALRVAMECEADWYVILEDDAVPVPNFRHEANRALKACPEKLASLYLGTSRPPQYQPQLKRLSRVGVHWLVGHTFLHGVCMAFHRDVVESVLERAQTISWDADQRYGKAAGHLGLKVAHSFPSLVDHRDEGTVTKHSDGAARDEPRRAWWLGTRDTWDPAKLEALNAGG